MRNRWTILLPPRSPVVRPTRGDFPHVRRRSVDLACGSSSTTCCFTLLGAAGGGLIGFIVGAVKAVRMNRMDREYDEGADRRTKRSLRVQRVFRFFLFSLGLAAVGLLVGAACGFVVDWLFVL